MCVRVCVLITTLQKLKYEIHTKSGMNQEFTPCIPIFGMKCILFGMKYILRFLQCILKYYLKIYTIFI